MFSLSTLVLFSVLHRLMSCIAVFLYKRQVKGRRLGYRAGFLNLDDGLFAVSHLKDIVYICALNALNLSSGVSIQKVKHNSNLLAYITYGAWVLRK